MNLKYFLAIFLLQIQPVFSKPDNPKLSAYERSLAIIYSAYSDVKLMEEICAKKFPEYKDQNSKAYSQWELKYLDYLNEINLHRQNMSFENAIDENGEIDFEMSIINMNELNKTIQDGNKHKEQEIMKEGLDKIKLVCKTYSTIYLNLDEINLESYFKEETKVIRKKMDFVIE